MAEEEEPFVNKVEEDLLEDEEIALEDSKEEELDDGENSSIGKWVSDNKMLIIAVIIVFLMLKWRFNDLRHRWFATWLAWYTKDVDAKAAEMKKDIFATLGSVVSHDPAFRKIGGLKILEVGVGTGLNFAYYPDGSHLTVIDPNPHFKEYYEANKKKFPNIHGEEIINCTGEEMDMIPDNSMDVVVVTLVFCSVEHPEKFLKQILRVLVPSGKFYFYEHIQEFDTKNHDTRRIIQNFLSASGIWPFIFDKCYLNRDMLKAVEAAGFSKVEAQRFYAPIDHFIFQLIKPSLKGVAEK